METGNPRAFNPDTRYIFRLKETYSDRIDTFATFYWTLVHGRDFWKLEKQYIWCNKVKRDWCWNLKNRISWTCFLKNSRIDTINNLRRFRRKLCPLARCRDNIDNSLTPPQKRVNASVKEVDRFLFAYCIIAHAMLYRCIYIYTEVYSVPPLYVTFQNNQVTYNFYTF